MKPEYPVAGGGLFLIKRLSNYVGKIKTRRYLLDTAVSLKKGDFNTPSVFLFYKKENGGFDCYFKTAAIQIGRVLADKQRFFYLLQSVSNRIVEAVI